MNAIKVCETMGCAADAEWRALFTERDDPKLIVEFTCTGCTQEYMQRVIRKYVSICPFPVRLHPITRAYYATGDRIELLMPRTDACLSAGVAGRRMQVEIQDGGKAQLYTLEGAHYCGPLLWEEVGILTDAENGNLPYTVSH